MVLPSWWESRSSPSSSESPDTFECRGSSVCCRVASLPARAPYTRRPLLDQPKRVFADRAVESCGRVRSVQRQDAVGVPCCDRSVARCDSLSKQRVSALPSDQVFAWTAGVRIPRGETVMRYVRSGVRPRCCQSVFRSDIGKGRVSCNPRPAPWYASVESVKRSAITCDPDASAGSMTDSTSCARAASNSSSSARAPTTAFGSSRSCRIASPSGVPPGSRTHSTAYDPLLARTRRGAGPAYFFPTRRSPRTRRRVHVPAVLKLETSAAEW